MVRKAGIDIGFDSTKGAIDDVTKAFESVIGRNFKSMRALGAQDGIIFEYPEQVAIADAAIRYAKHVTHSKKLNWWQSEEFRWLFYGIISELVIGSEDVTVIAGLPISTYKDHAADVEQLLTGTHVFQRLGRDRQQVQVKCIAFPQCFGVACDELLDGSGNIISQKAAGRIGVIDMGGWTTNVLWLEKFRDVAHKTECIEIGCWKIIELLKQSLQQATGRVFSEYDTREALMTGYYSHDGQTIKCEALRQEAINEVFRMVTEQIDNIDGWRDSHALDTIYLGGGGMYHMGKQFCEKYSQAVQAKNLILGNALGFAKYGRGFLDA